MKCKHCKSTHKNRGGAGEVRDICFVCELTEERLLTFIKAMNEYQPINGKKRKITLLGYTIEINNGETTNTTTK